jgi:hypothetical protein
MKTMKHRAMLAQAICDEGLRRIAEAATEAGLPELATEAEALLPWLPTIAAEAMETTESAAPPRSPPPGGRPQWRNGRLKASASRRSARAC